MSERILIELLKDRNCKEIKRVASDIPEVQTYLIGTSNEFTYHASILSTTNKKIMSTFFKSIGSDVVVKKDVKFILSYPKKLNMGKFSDVITTIDKVDVFVHTDLYFNPTKTRFCPKYTLLTQPEEEDFLTMNKVERDKMPLILTSERIVKWMGWKKGIVRIDSPKLLDFRVISDA